MLNNICQSCGMIMEKNGHGTNSDGSISEDYCKYCFNYGKFGKDETMEEMIESCIPFWVDKEKGIDEETARKNMLNIFPNLKRWKNLNSAVKE
ncbi:MAG: transcriptional regulator [Lachnospiraceae bacterium]|nr:transcriptional regulator [Lachnospiraceae bacterium]